MRSGSGNLEAAIAEAVAAFDAGNHAFGRFVTYAVRPQGEAIPASVQAVREYFQDAALAVPESPSAEAAQAFLAALRRALAVVEEFLTRPPAGYALEEAVAAPGPLREAIDVLSAALESSGED
jgi:hypothetical protein